MKFICYSVLKFICCSVLQFLRITHVIGVGQPMDPYRLMSGAGLMQKAAMFLVLLKNDWGDN